MIQRVRTLRPPPNPLWRDRSGRFSAVRLAGAALALGPGLWLLWRLRGGGLGGSPLEAAIDETGLWALRLLFASLAITPLRRIGAWSRPIIVRRMLGLATLGYTLTHLLLYVADQGWNLAMTASEIVMRLYLTLGFLALLGLAALGATSTDRMIRRLGARWRSLHRWVYLLAPLGLVHFTLQSKIDVTEPAWMAGALMLLMGWRAAHARGLPLTSPSVLAGLALTAALLTAAAEASWYGLATGIPPMMVLAANLEFGYRLSPAWIVLALGAAPALYRLGAALNGRRLTAAAGS